MITFDFNRLALQPQERVLDMGCGSGRHTCATYQRHQGLVVGLDVNLTDLQTARNNLHLHDRLRDHCNGRWSLAAADVRHLPFADASFDVVLCCEVLEHVPLDSVALRELTRILKKGGRLVVSVPRCYPEKLCWKFSRTYHQNDGGHIRIYRFSQLRRRLTDADIRIQACHYAHSLHTPYWWLKCLMGCPPRDTGLLKLYHRLLVWDMMRKPVLTRFLEWLLNPVLGKSVVVYGVKV